MYEVFRIEHETSLVGPFQTDDLFCQELAEKANRSRRLRSPGDDGLGLANIPWDYAFGCLSLEALKEWFLLGNTPEENRNIVKQLDEKGFVLAVFLVEDDHIFIGRSQLQVAFNAKACRRENLVETHPLRYLLQSHDSSLETC